MKKLMITVAMSLMFALAANAQELPFGEYLNYTPEQFKEAGFKFRNRWNQWFPKAAAYESNNGHAPFIALGKNGEIAEVRVHFITSNPEDQEMMQTVLAFMKEHGENPQELGRELKSERFVTQEKVTKCEYGKYVLGLTEIAHIDNKDGSSFSMYRYTIWTEVEAWSRVTERWQRKRDRKDAQENQTPNAEEPGTTEQ